MRPGGRCGGAAVAADKSEWCSAHRSCQVGRSLVGACGPRWLAVCWWWRGPSLWRNGGGSDRRNRCGRSRRCGQVAFVGDSGVVGGEGGCSSARRWRARSSRQRRRSARSRRNSLVLADVEGMTQHAAPHGGRWGVRPGSSKSDKGERSLSDATDRAADAGDRDGRAGQAMRCPCPLTYFCDAPLEFDRPSGSDSGCASTLGHPRVRARSRGPTLVPRCTGSGPGAASFSATETATTCGRRTGNTWGASSVTSSMTMTAATSASSAAATDSSPIARAQARTRDPNAQRKQRIDRDGRRLRRLSCTCTAEDVDTLRARTATYAPPTTDRVARRRGHRLSRGTSAELGALGFLPFRASVIAAAACSSSSTSSPTLPPAAAGTIAIAAPRARVRAPARRPRRGRHHRDREVAAGDQGHGELAIATTAIVTAAAGDQAHDELAIGELAIGTAAVAAQVIIGRLGRRSPRRRCSRATGARSGRSNAAGGNAGITASYKCQLT
jgi:hypothetical protein